MSKHRSEHDNEHPDTEYPDSENLSTEEISKSQRKRDMHALQALGQQLVDLPKEQFEKITLEENLRDAIIDAGVDHAEHLEVDPGTLKSSHTGLAQY